MNTPESEHITLEQAVEWLTRIGCTDIVIVGDHLIKLTMSDGYRTTTDIREHFLKDIQSDVALPDNT